MRAILLNSSMNRVIIVLEDVRLLVFVGNFLASNSSRYIALSNGLSFFFSKDVVSVTSGCVEKK